MRPQFYLWNWFCDLSQISVPTSEMHCLSWNDRMKPDKMLYTVSIPLDLRSSLHRGGGGHVLRPNIPKQGYPTRPIPGHPLQERNQATEHVGVHRWTSASCGLQCHRRPHPRPLFATEPIHHVLTRDRRARLPSRVPQERHAAGDPLPSSETTPLRSAHHRSVFCAQRLKDFQKEPLPDSFCGACPANPAGIGSPIQSATDWRPISIGRNGLPSTCNCQSRKHEATGCTRREK